MSSAWQDVAFEALLDLTRDHRSLGNPLTFDKQRHDASEWHQPLGRLTLHFLGGPAGLENLLLDRLDKHESQGLLLPPFDPFKKESTTTLADAGMPRYVQQSLLELALVLRLGDKLNSKPLVHGARERLRRQLEDCPGVFSMDKAWPQGADLLKTWKANLDSTEHITEWRHGAVAFLAGMQPWLSEEALALAATNGGLLAPSPAEIMQLLRHAERPWQVQAAAVRLALEYGDADSLFILSYVTCPQGSENTQVLRDLIGAKPSKVEAALSLLRTSFNAYRSQSEQDPFPAKIPDPLAYGCAGLFHPVSESADNWFYRGNLFEWLASVLELDSKEMLSFAYSDSRVPATSLSQVAELLSASPYLEREERAESVYGTAAIARHIDFWSFPPATTREQMIARAARLLDNAAAVREMDKQIEVPVQMSQDFYNDGRGFCAEGRVDVKLEIPSAVTESFEGAHYIYGGEYKATRYRVDGTQGTGKLVDVIGFIPRQETSAIVPTTRTSFYFPLEAASCSPQERSWTPPAPSSITLSAIQKAANEPCEHPDPQWIQISKASMSVPLGVQACCTDCGRSHLAVVPIWQLGGEMIEGYSPGLRERFCDIALIACNIQRCAQGLDPYATWQELREHEPMIDPTQVQIKPSLGYSAPAPNIDDMEWESFSL